jgi:hypothetical protein
MYFALNGAVRRTDGLHSTPRADRETLVWFAYC